MDAMYANYYTREVMIILIREFQTPDEEMKKIVLKVVAQCVGTEGVEPDYIRQVRCQLFNELHAFAASSVTGDLLVLDHLSAPKPNQHRACPWQSSKHSDVSLLLDLAVLMAGVRTALSRRSCRSSSATSGCGVWRSTGATTSSWWRPRSSSPKKSAAPRSDSAASCRGCAHLSACWCHCLAASSLTTWHFATLPPKRMFVV